MDITLTDKNIRYLEAIHTKLESICNNLKEHKLGSTYRGTDLSNIDKSLLIRLNRILTNDNVFIETESTSVDEDKINIYFKFNNKLLVLQTKMYYMYARRSMELTSYMAAYTLFDEKITSTTHLNLNYENKYFHNLSLIAEKIYNENKKLDKNSEEEIKITVLKCGLDKLSADF